MNIFGKMNWGGSIPMWKEISRRRFTEEELNLCASSTGEVVAGDYCLKLKITLIEFVESKQQYVVIPICAEVKVGDLIPLKDCVIVTLKRRYDDLCVDRIYINS